MHGVYGRAGNVGLLVTVINIKSIFSKNNSKDGNLMSGKEIIVCIPYRNTPKNVNRIIMATKIIV